MALLGEKKLNCMWRDMQLQVFLTVPAERACFAPRHVVLCVHLCMGVSQLRLRLRQARRNECEANLVVHWKCAHTALRRLAHFKYVPAGIQEESW